jgi:hypothetical protein
MTIRMIERLYPSIVSPLQNYKFSSVRGPRFHEIQLIYSTTISTLHTPQSPREFTVKPLRTAPLQTTTIRSPLPLRPIKHAILIITHEIGTPHPHIHRLSITVTFPGTLHIYPRERAPPRTQHRHYHLRQRNEE